MEFFRKQGLKNNDSATNHSPMTISTPKIKRKLYIGFGQRRRNNRRGKPSKHFSSIHAVEQFFTPQKTALSKKESIEFHENIDVFLEKMTKERLPRDTLPSKEKHPIQTLTPRTMIQSEDEELSRTKEKMEILVDEVRIRSQLIDDLEHQILERQTLLVEKTETVKQLQKELQLRDTNLKRLTDEFEQKEKEFTLIQKEIIKKNRIIQNIEGQLAEKQKWIVENNHFAEQLNRELEQNNRLFEKLQSEIMKKDEQCAISEKEFLGVQDEMEGLRREIASRNTIIESFENQLEEQQLSLLQKTQWAESLRSQIDEMNKQIPEQQRISHEELQALALEIETRNRIIESLKKQLTENQTRLVHHSHTTEHVQEELKQNESLIQELHGILEQKQQDLMVRDNELQTQGLQLQKVCADLDMLRGEIDSRSRIIEDLEEQLMEQQTLLVEKTQIVEHLQGELERKQKGIVRHKGEANRIRIQLEKKDQEMTNLKTELEERSHDLEFRNTDLNGKQELIQKLEKDIESALQEIKEKNMQLLSCKQELKDKEIELNNLRFDSEKKWIDLVLANIENRDNREKINELDLRLEQRENLLRGAEVELENRTQEFIITRQELGDQIQSLTMEIATRSKLIEDMEKQLADRQILLIEKTSLVETLQTEVLTRDNDMNHRREVGTFDSLQKEIISRNHIIDALRTQLSENQTGLLEKTVKTEQLHETLEQHQHRLRNTESELKKMHDELNSSKELLEKKDSELHCLQQKLDTKGKDLLIKEQEITVLTKQFQDIFTNFKAATSTKETSLQIPENQSVVPNRPLDVLKDDQPVILDEKKSFAGDIDHIMKNGQEHSDHLQENITLKEKLQICNEIERCLDRSSDDHLKTKKLKDDEEAK